MAAVALVVVGQLLVQRGQLAAQLDLLFLAGGLRQRRFRRLDPRLQEGPAGHRGEHSGEDRSRRQLGQLLR